jgi:tRNA dimethylallyltransferase
MTPSPEVLALFGPTAAGKSALAHALALRIGAEIVVADPFQRYRGLEIAADAPRPQERAEVTYHLVGDLELTEASSAGAYGHAAHRVIDDIIARGRTPLVTGGTGLYLRAATSELGFPPMVDDGLRAWAERLVSDDPADAAAELRRRDPGAAARVDLANPRRLARALEVAAARGSAPHPTDRLWDDSARRPTVLVAVTRPREILDRLIAVRVRRELEDGLADELRRALATPGLTREARQIIGVREIERVDAGEITDAELHELLAARTRRLARRQLSWLRRWPHAHVIDLGDATATAAIDHVLALWRSDDALEQ